MKWIEKLSMVVLCIAGSSQLAYAQQQQGQTQTQTSNRTATAGRTGTTGTGGTGGTGTDAAPSMAVDTSAGSSDNISREFNEGFVGRTDNPDRFIGSQQAGPQQFNQRTPNFQNRASNVQGGTPSKESKVRPVFRLGEEFALERVRYPRPLFSTAIPLSSSLQRRPQFASLRVSFSTSGNVILEGVVKTDRDKKLAEALLRLEPGINSVDNQIVVVP